MTSRPVYVLELSHPPARPLGNADPSMQICKWIISINTFDVLEVRSGDHFGVCGRGSEMSAMPGQLGHEEDASTHFCVS